MYDCDIVVDVVVAAADVAVVAVVVVGSPITSESGKIERIDEKRDGAREFGRREERCTSSQ